MTRKEVVQLVVPWWALGVDKEDPEDKDTDGVEDKDMEEATLEAEKYEDVSAILTCLLRLQEEGKTKPVLLQPRM